MKGEHLVTMAIVMVAGTVLMQADVHGETAGKADALAKGKQVFTRHLPMYRVYCPKHFITNKNN